MATASRKIHFSREDATPPHNDLDDRSATRPQARLRAVDGSAVPRCEKIDTPSLDQLESMAVGVGRMDTTSAALARGSSFWRSLFGMTVPNGLADPALEGLRMLVVELHHGRLAPEAAVTKAIAAGARPAAAAFVGRNCGPAMELRIHDPRRARQHVA